MQNTYLRRIKEFFPNRYIDEITYMDVEDFRRWREKKILFSSVNREHTVLTHLFNKLRLWRRKKIIANIKLPEENPAALVKKPSEKSRIRKRILQPDEYERLKKVSPPELWRIIEGALQTMLRPKDLKALTRNNIDREANEIRGIQAKTGKPYAIHINGPIQALLDPAPGFHIFDFTNFRKNFEKAVAQAKLKDFQFKDLRRTGATKLLKKSGDLKAVSEYLGHSSIAMTESYIAGERESRKVSGELMATIFPQQPATSQSLPSSAVTSHSQA
jgi:integrase